MSDITWSDVLLACDNDPILTAFVSGGQTLILAVVNTQLDPLMFDSASGPIYKLARCYLAAHMAASAKLGVAGPVIGESEGGVSRQYALPPMNRSLMSTSYGAVFFQLISSKAHGPQLAVPKTFRPWGC